MMNTLSPELTQNFSISLSREELYIVMRLIRARRIPGFDLTWLNLTPEGLPTEETRMALEAATNALVARGYLGEGHAAKDDQLALSLPSPVVALVGTCAFGEYSIALPVRTSGEPRLLYLHELQGLGVIHSMPIPGIHRFEAVEGREGILHVLDTVLALDAQIAGIALPDGHVTAVALQAARDAAFTGNIDDAVQLLVKGGLPLATARELGSAMKNPESIGAIIIASREVTGEQQEGALAVVVTAAYCFQLTNEGTSSQVFRVRSVSAIELRQWVLACLPLAGQK